MMQLKVFLMLATTSLLLGHSLSFVFPQQRPRLALVMDMSAGGNKKRRRRKEAPTGATALDPIKLEREKVEGSEGLIDEDDVKEATMRTDELSQLDLKPDGIAQGKSPLC